MSDSVVVYGMLAVAICTIHLCVGVWIGVAVEGRSHARAAPSFAQVDAQYLAKLAEVTTLARHARSLSNACLEHQAELPASVVRKAEFVAKRSDRLQKGMESLNRSLQSHKRMRRSVSSPKHSPPPQIDGPHVCDRGVRKTRLPKAWQYVAPLQGEAFPDAEQFHLVLCRNVTSRGFSLFSQESPSFDSLIVAMGAPPGLCFYLVEVTRVSVATLNGETGHRVDCKFVRKLMQIYQWDDQAGKITAASSLAT